MADEIVLPHLVVKTDKSQFRLRCHAAAWADQYGGNVTIRRRHKQISRAFCCSVPPGRTPAVKSARATLYQPDIDAAFLLDGDTEQPMVKARATFDGKPVTYQASVVKLGPGVVHLVALANIPGLMPNMSDDHLWTELSSPRFTTPLLGLGFPG